MASEFERRSIGRALLRRFPPFLQMALVEGDAFREELGLQIGTTLSLDEGRVDFDRDTFLAACAALYAGPDADVPLMDAEAATWRLSHDGHDQGRPILTLTNGDLRHRMIEPPGVDPDRDARLKTYDAAVECAGLPAGEMAGWRDLVSERILNGEEIGALEQSLRDTVAQVERRLQIELRKAFNLDVLVPDAPAYWERLVGTGAPADLAGLAAQVRAHVAEVRAARGFEGAKHALLLAGHVSLVIAADLASLPADELVALATWAAESGDLLAKLAMIEASLAAIPRVPELAPFVEQMVGQLLALDAADQAGPLWLWSALVVLVDGQLSHLRIAKNWPPFRRRHAAIAQAALIARCWPAERESAPFSDGAMNARGGRYYLQTLVDLQQEPRWRPDYGGPEQWRNEIMGRLANAAGLHADAIARTSLAPLMTGREPGGVLASVNMPGSFFPGPLEGSGDTASSPPPVLEEMLEKALAGDRLDRSSFAVLINVCGLYSVGNEKVARATKLFEDAGHRLPPDTDPDDAESLLAGLAGLAASSRSPALAEELRIMARRRRLDGVRSLPLRQIGLAMTAAAAHEDRRAWAMAAGDWLREIAFETDDRASAQEMLDALETLALISPYLRGGLGRGIAALRSFLAI